MHRRPLPRVVVISSLLTLSGCAALLGFEDYVGGGAGAGGTGGGVGTGGSVGCTPGFASPCYGGPQGTESVGACKAGVHVCSADGTGFGACVGEVVPTAEDCATLALDESCDGTPICNGAHLWSQRFGDAADGQNGISLAADAAGNVLVVGQLSGSADFGMGTLVTAGGGDVYLAKFDPSGKPLWSRVIGAGDSEEAAGVAIDDAGDVLLAGRFNGKLDFGDGELVTAGSSDVFLVKLDASGKPRWTKRFGDAAKQFAYSVAVDHARNVVFVGSFLGSIDFGNGPLMSAGGADVFVAKFDPSGKPLWSQRFGDVGEENCYAAATDDAGDIFIAGSFTSTMNFGAATLTSAGNNDIFVAKLGPSGEALWSTGFGDAADQLAAGIAADAAGNAIVVGHFAGTVDFGDGPRTSAGGIDIFVAKLEAGSGKALWTKGFGDAELQQVDSVTVDGAGNAVIAGWFQGSVDLGKGPVKSAGKDDILLAKLDTETGSTLWSKRFGDADNQYGYAVTTDAGGNVLLTGWLFGTLDLGGGPLVSAGGSDIFLAKFAP